MTTFLFRPVLRTLFAGMVVLLGAGPLSAQEGHPFDGTWRGTLEGEDGESRRVLLIMKYDGEEIGGMINPGRNSIAIQSSELDAPNWLLTVRAESSAGPVEFSGTLHEIGARNRYITGSWNEGGEEYDFRVTRE